MGEAGGWESHTHKIALAVRDKVNLNFKKNQSQKLWKFLGGFSGAENKIN